MLILDWIFLWFHDGGGGGGFLLWVICGFTVVMVVAGGFWVLFGWVCCLVLGSQWVCCDGGFGVVVLLSVVLCLR